MQTYGDSSRNSGVVGFALLRNGLLVQFRNGAKYLYDDSKPGREHRLHMQKLAVAGRGLSTYISRNVHDCYSRKLSG